MKDCRLKLIRRYPFTYYNNLVFIAIIAGNMEFYRIYKIYILNIPKTCIRIQITNASVINASLSQVVCEQCNAAAQFYGNLPV